MSIPTPTAPRLPASDASIRQQALDALRRDHHLLLLDPERHRTELRAAIDLAVAEAGGDAEAATKIRDFVLGAGHLQRLLDDTAVTEIMAIGRRVWVERGGKVEESEGFGDADESFRLAERMALRRGERFQLAQPIVDFAWLDGSRVNLVHPSLTDGNVGITVRKPDRSRPLDLASLIESGTLCQGAADLLVAAVGRDRRNLLFTGAQGSGKTALMRAVLNVALDGTTRRVVLIEDTPELFLTHRHVLAERSRTPSPGLGGAGAVTLADLTKTSKRQRPELVVMGEVRGAEGVDLIGLAQSEGCGVASTLHIGQPEDLAARFYYFATLANLAISPSDIKTWVFATFHLCCHLDKDADGRRRVMRIVRLDAATQTMTDLYHLEQGRLVEVGA